MRVLIYAIAVLGGIVVGALILWAMFLGWTEKREGPSEEEYHRWLS